MRFSLKGKNSPAFILEGSQLCEHSVSTACTLSTPADIPRPPSHFQPPALVQHFIRSAQWRPTPESAWAVPEVFPCKSLSKSNLWGRNSPCQHGAVKTTLYSDQLPCGSALPVPNSTNNSCCLPLEQRLVCLFWVFYNFPHIWLPNGTVNISVENMSVMKHSD